MIETIGNTNLTKPEIEFEGIFKMKLDTKGSMNINYVYQQMIKYLNIGIMVKLEENFGCSGICQSSLFYFSRDISDGFPTDTCLEKVVRYL